jgi:hypothetical protein
MGTVNPQRRVPIPPKTPRSWDETQSLSVFHADANDESGLSMERLATKTLGRGHCRQRLAVLLKLNRHERGAICHIRFGLYSVQVYES